MSETDSDSGPERWLLPELKWDGSAETVLKMTSHGAGIGWRVDFSRPRASFICVPMLGKEGEFFSLPSGLPIPPGLASPSPPPSLSGLTGVMEMRSPPARRVKMAPATDDMAMGLSAPQRPPPTTTTTDDIPIPPGLASPSPPPSLSRLTGVMEMRSPPARRVKMAPATDDMEMGLSAPQRPPPTTTTTDDIPIPPGLASPSPPPSLSGLTGVMEMRSPPARRVKMAPATDDVEMGLSAPQRPPPTTTTTDDIPIPPGLASPSPPPSLSGLTGVMEMRSPPARRVKMAPATDDMEMGLSAPQRPPPTTTTTDDMEKRRRAPPPPPPTTTTDDMEMPLRALGSNGSVSALKPELTMKAHEPNKDYKLLKDAYCSMKANGVYNNAIFKQRTPSGNTVLHLAASYGKDAMVEKVAQHATELFTVANDNYDTALHIAAKTGHGTTIKSLLNEFLLFVSRETNGHGHQSILELMLMVSFTLFRNKQGNTFLHEAFRTSSHNGAVIFEAFEAPSIFGDSNEFDEARYKKVVHDLATFEVNVEGKSLLYLTIEANCKPGVNQLMNYCSEGSLKPKGKSPLLPALINKNIGMLKIILGKDGGWIHLRNKQGWLPLHHAVLLGFLQGVNYLVGECPSCTMERDNNGSLPIHLACIKGHVKIVQALLEFCPDPADMVNGNGQNLLHIACACRNYELVRYLLEDPKLKMMINQKDINGNTPLHLATISGHPKIVHALTWDNRVDLSVLNNENLTALDIAEISQGKTVSLSQRLTWNALVSAGTPQSSVRFHPKKVETGNTTSDIDKNTHTTEPYKDRIDTLIVVSTLIITTSFAVGFTFPGDVEQGIPILLNRPMFHLFILSFTISAFGAISSTIILMWARLGDLRLAIFALHWAIPLLGLSLTSLSLAFLAGVYLIISKLSWLATTFLVIGVVLILMVECLYLLLLLPSKSSLPFSRYISYYPFLFFANIAEGKMDANKMGSKAIIPVL